MLVSLFMLFCSSGYFVCLLKTSQDASAMFPDVVVVFSFSFFFKTMFLDVEFAILIRAFILLGDIEFLSH